MQTIQSTPARVFVLVHAALLSAVLGAAPAPAAAQAPAPEMVLLASFPVTPPPAATAPGGEKLLIIPVWGVEPGDLHDTFNDARSGGRVHDAIDIHAPRGTPVLATTDGEIIKLHSGARGGLSIYQLDADGRTRYYYAHLERYAPGMHEGRRVRRGEVIGYVGDTGNAQPGDYHLHFSIAVLRSRSRWWEGENLNPFTILRRSYAGL